MPSCQCTRPRTPTMNRRGADDRRCVQHLRAPKAPRSSCAAAAAAATAEQPLSSGGGSGDTGSAGGPVTRGEAGGRPGGRLGALSTPRYVGIQACLHGAAAARGGRGDAGRHGAAGAPHWLHARMRDRCMAHWSGGPSSSTQHARGHRKRAACAHNLRLPQASKARQRRRHTRSSSRSRRRDAGAGADTVTVAKTRVKNAG